MSLLNVPAVPRTIVFNRKIVYSDTPLPLLVNEERPEITAIENVSEAVLEDCLENVLRTNSTVLFYMIQFSKKNKTVWFFTNISINIQEWDNFVERVYQPLDHANLLSSIDEVFTREENREENYISLYAVAKRISQVYQIRESASRRYQEVLKQKLCSKFPNSHLYLYDFDDEKKTLKIHFRIFYDSNDIVFSKRNGELFIVKSKSTYSQEILELLGSQLSRIYDELAIAVQQKKQNQMGIEIPYSNFKVDITDSAVKLYILNPNIPEQKEFELSSCGDHNDYQCRCSSDAVMKALEGNEQEFLSKIFIPIECCPEWSRDGFYKKRQEELSQNKEKQKKLGKLFTRRK